MPRKGAMFGDARREFENSAEQVSHESRSKLLLQSIHEDIDADAGSVLADVAFTLQRSVVL